MNNVSLIGRLTRDPELRYTPNGVAVATFIIAVDRRFKSEGQPEADFIPVVVWQKTAEVVAEFCRKGRQVGVTGRLETRRYENSEGNRVYVTEVIADGVDFLAEPQGHPEPQEQPRQQQQQRTSGNNRGGNNNNRGGSNRK